MQIWSKQTLKSVIVRGGILLGVMAIVTHTGWLTLPLPALNFIYYCALIGGMLLAWRFRSRRTFLALLVLFLAGQVQSIYGLHGAATGTAGWTALVAVAVLVPLNFVLISFMQERGLDVSSLGPPGLLLFVQVIIVTVLCRAGETSASMVSHSHHPAAISFPPYVPMAIACAGVFLLVKSVISRKPAEVAQFWALLAFYLSIQFLTTPRIAAAYSATTVCILAISIIENSYLLAYHDELTGLPSRRAFNDAVLRLQDPYSIAAVDIDHFKRFNDTYGHDTGDQVLRLVATKLARVSGGGQAYRCGGEEFNILFPGKTVAEVLSHLEQLRAAIQGTEFHMRGGDRRHAPRGPDRRLAHKSGRPRTGHAIRRLSKAKAPESISVTVSMGVANCSRENPHFDLVLQAADKALYRAKDAGRNRVETAPASRPRAQAAGIA